MRHSTRFPIALSILALGAFASAAFAVDADSDGLSADEETALGTSDSDTDSDDDGVSDFDEVYALGTLPTVEDTDGDSADDSETYPLDNGDHTGGSAPSLSGAPTGTPYAWSGESAQDGVGVYVHNGEFVHTFSLGRTKGVGLDLEITATYRSQSQYQGSMGNGVTWMGDWKLTVLGNGNVKILCEDGVEREFVWNSGTSSFTSPLGCTCILVETSADHYKRYWPNGAGPSTCGGCGCGPGIQEIGYANGRFDYAADRFDNRITATYDDDLLVELEDTRGITATIGYYESERVQSITFAGADAPTTLEFNQFGQLMNVFTTSTTSFGAGIQTQLRYTNGFDPGDDPELNGNMIAIVDGTGAEVLENHYDSSDRVDRQFIGGIDPVFDYSNITSQETTVTDRNENERVWTWNSSTYAKATLVEKTNRNVRSGEGDYTTTWTHDADGYLTSVIYPRGNGVKYTLNSVKLPTEVRRKTLMTNADNNTNDIVDAYVYDSSKYYGMTQHTNPCGHVTDYTLNSKGQPTLIEFPEVTNVDDDYRVEHAYAYNSNGTVDTFTDGEGTVTKYAYYTDDPRKGRVQTVTRDYGTGKLNLATTYDYESWGSVKSVTDPRGNTTSYTTEFLGNVTQIAAPTALGYVTKFEHDAALRVVLKKVKNIDHEGTWLSSPQWWETETAYSVTGKVLSVVEDITAASSRTTTYEYDDDDNLTAVVRGDRRVEMQYDERGLLYKRIRDPGSSPHIAATEEFAYDGNRNLTEHKNARNKVTTYTYDLFDRRTKVTNALGHYQDTVYDKCGNVLEVKSYDATPSPDVLMAHHKTTFDEMDRAWKDEDLHIENSNAWYARTRVFDLDSRVVTATDRLSRDTTHEYDAVGRPTKTTDPIGNETQWTYDAGGNVTRVRQVEKIPGSSSTESFDTDFTYDAVNRQATQKVIDRTNSSNWHLTSWERDALNFVCKTTDPKGNVVTFVRDGLGRTLEKHEDMGSSAEIVTKWTHDIHDGVTQLEDDNGSDTDYAFDKLGRLVTKTYENAKTVTYEYDANGNVTEITDQSGSVLAYGYDDLDRRIGCDITPATGVGGDTEETWAYDALGRMTQAADDDSIVNFTYDSLSRVLTEQQGSNPLGSTGKTVSYAWNAESERTKVTYPSGFEARETRDDLGRTTEIKDQSNVSVATFARYGAGGRLKTLGSGNGMTGTWTYDGFRRPTDIAHKTSGNTERAGFEYGWDANDNPTYEERRHISGTGDVYTYDKANRLTKVLRDVADPSAEVATPNSQSYDKKLEYDMDAWVSG